ncbi:MAG: AAA family ATPase, partial [Pseudomonadales bacterium]|nr:AAA family ATPase [Pseudomonadales bacterium]
MNEIQRTRLLGGLQADHLPDLIAIFAPAGYGKTTFTRQLLTWCGHASSYITLHPLQRDSQSLLNACIRSLTEDVADLNLDDVETAWDLCHILEQKLTHPYLLVLDDVHLLKGSPPTEKWLVEMLTYLPSQLHLVLVGQEPPALPFSQLIAEKRLLVFNREDLRVTEHEFRTVSNQPETELKNLVERMDGWITGIQLALDSKNTAVKTVNLPDKDLPQERFNILVRANFERFSPDRRIFLLQTALVETIEPRLCHEVFGQTAWMAHIQALEKGHFYLRQEGHGYRYHNLLRNFLQDYARTTHPQQFKHWHQRLANWFKREDLPGVAIWHSLQAGDIEHARNYADEIAKEWHITGLWSGLLQIRDWLGLHAGPKLQLMCGMILTDWNRLDESNHLLQDAYQAFVRQGDGLNQCRALLQVASNHFAHGDYRTVKTLAEGVIHHADCTPALEAWAGRMLAWTKMELGAYNDALEGFEAILNNFSENERGFGRASILQDMSLAYFGTGQLEAAGRCLLEGLALRRQMQDSKEISLGLNNLAYYYHLQSQYDEAQIALDEAFDLIPRRDDRIAALVQWTQADLYRDIGQFEHALMAYEEGLVLARNHHHVYLNLLLNLARMRCWQEQWQDAHHILAEAREIEILEQALLAQRCALMEALLDAREDGLPTHVGVIQTLLD